jgi:hypothetical protein
MIPQEAPYEIEERKPPAQWPEHGAVEFNNVTMAYRPGLPNVLRSISVKVRAGEKIGVVGRSTGLLHPKMCANAAFPQDRCWQIVVDACIVSNCRVVRWFNHCRWVRRPLIVTNEFSRLLVSIYLQLVFMTSAPRFLSSHKMFVMFSFCTCQHGTDVRTQ